jgi:hypothetical protein
MTMTLIETKTLGAAAASIEFTSIPQTFTDLIIVSSLRTDNNPDSSDYGIAGLSINGSTANITSRALVGSGSAASSSSGTAINIVTAGSSNTASTFGNFALYISNYTSSVAKSLSLDNVTENNATRAWQVIQAGLWNSSSALTSFGFTASASGNFVTGSTISLYGITKGTDGIVTTS